MPNRCIFSPRNLQHEFTNHASDFSVIGNWNKANADLFKQVIQAHVAHAPQQISGTFRSLVFVTHYFDPVSSLWVAVDLADVFVAGWKLYPSQVVDLLTKGNIK